MIDRWRNMGRNTRIVVIALMLWGIGEGLWLYIQPLYLSSLGVSAEETGFILSASGLARLAIMVPAGLLADRYGARNVMIPGWMLGALAVIVLAAATNTYLLALGFFLYGASALSIPITNVYMVQSIQADSTVTRQHTPQEILTFVYGLYWLSQIISPALGGLIGQLASLRAVFWISAFWFCLSTVAVWQTTSYPTPPPERFKRRIEQYRSLLSQKHLVVLYGLFTLGFIATILGFTFAPQYLEDAHGLSRGAIGVLGSALAGGSFFWNITMGRYRAWTGFLGSISLTALSFVLLLVSGHVIVFVLSYFLLGSYETLRPIATGIVAAQTETNTQGVAFSLVDTLHGASSFVAAALAGVLYATNNTTPFIVAVVLVPVIYLATYSVASRMQVVEASAD
ncbi:MAG: MFS transporter [Chloroflexi bacterium]|nr:MFS transporter [Chloroflexota bacterium]